MAPRQPSKSEADHLIQIPKAISAKVIWKPDGKSWRLRTKAIALDQDDIFDIVAYIGRTNYSFVLLYSNYPIRKFTKHSPHRIGGKIFTDPHKHVWDGETENRIAYIPDDIDADSDLNEQFLAFLAECNIKLVGDYQSVAYQIK